MSDVKQAYNEMGRHYAAVNREFFSQAHDPARTFIRSWLCDVEGKAILDVGCGAGDDVREYENMPFASVEGVDVAETMVAQAKTVVKNPDCIRLGSFESTGCPDERVDFATSRFVLHYLLNFDQAYDEVARVLKPGGFFVAAVDHPLADYVESEKVVERGVTYCRTKLYKGQVTLPLYPLHNISHYLSKTFFRNFELLEIDEAIGTDRDWQEGPNELFFAAKKR